MNGRKHALKRAFVAMFASDHAASDSQIPDDRETSRQLKTRERYEQRRPAHVPNQVRQPLAESWQSVPANPTESMKGQYRWRAVPRWHGRDAPVQTTAPAATRRTLDKLTPYFKRKLLRLRPAVGTCCGANTAPLAPAWPQSARGFVAQCLELAPGGHVFGLIAESPQNRIYI